MSVTTVLKDVAKVGRILEEVTGSAIRDAAECRMIIRTNDADFKAFSTT